ncbi:MAG: hypothetical protein IJ088_02175 [Clostridia bacterium]|nr:hypothetical protein [Clostridia bacterium]
MADKLRFNEESLRSIVSDLVSVAEQLDAIKGKIDGISLEEEAGALHRIGVDSHRLIFGRDFGGYDTVEDHLGSLSQAVLGESLAAGKISSNLSQVIEQILACENSIAKVIGDEVHPMTEEQKIAESIEQAQIEAILNILKNARNPEDLISVMKRENFGVFKQLATGIWSFISGKWHDIGEQQKERYLFKKGLHWADTANVSIIDPTKSVDSVLGDAYGFLKDNVKILKKVTEVANLCDLEKVDKLTDQQFIEELSSNLKDNPALAESVTKLLSKNTSLNADQISDFQANLEIIGKLETISKVTKAIDTGKKAIKSGVEIYNELQILNSVDKNQMLETARVYLESSDSAMQATGEKLTKLANASEGERIAMIAGGELVDLGFDEAYSTLYKAGVKQLGKANPIVLTAQITTDVTDMLTGVNDVPGLQNELAFSTAAAKSTYEVLQNDIATYEANPTEANLQKCVTSYTTYQQQVATAEESADALFQIGDDAIVPWHHLNDEAREQMEQCVRSAESARNAVNRMNTLNHNREVAATAKTGDGNLDGLIN